MKITNPFQRSNDLPSEYRSLIEVIRANHESSGGANRAAVAELQARSAWELNRATNSLRVATWVLAFSTCVLCLITLING